MNISPLIFQPPLFQESQPLDNQLCTNNLSPNTIVTTSEPPAHSPIVYTYGGELGEVGMDKVGEMDWIRVGVGKEGNKVQDLK